MSGRFVDFRRWAVAGLDCRDAESERGSAMQRIVGKRISTTASSSAPEKGGGGGGYIEVMTVVASATAVSGQFRQQRRSEQHIKKDTDRFRGAGKSVTLVDQTGQLTNQKVVALAPEPIFVEHSRASSSWYYCCPFSLTLL